MTAPIKAVPFRSSSRLAPAMYDRYRCGFGRIVESHPNMQSTDELESPHKGQRGLRRLFIAFFYSISGLRLAFDHESAFRQEILIAAILVPVACVCRPPPWGESC